MEYSGNYNENGDMITATISVSPRLVHNFSAGYKNKVVSNSKKEQMHAFSVSKGSE